jgi:Tfp pilus assembly protein PilF
VHQFPEAAEEFAQALRFSPDAADSHNNLGAVLLQLGDYEKAAEQFKEAIKINPTYTDAKENLNLAQTELNTHKKQ